MIFYIYYYIKQVTTYSYIYIKKLQSKSLITFYIYYYIKQLKFISTIFKNESLMTLYI